MTTNYSLYSIPVFWFISLFPHAYGASLIKKANNDKWNNINPRGGQTNEKYQKSVPKETYAAFERAEAAHKNAMENAPFYIGAVIAGNMAGVNAGTMNLFSGAYIGLRILYAVLYVNTTTQKNSYLRSLVWFASILTVTGLYIKAGNAWGAKV